jgi:hypothetical protein
LHYCEFSFCCYHQQPNNKKNNTGLFLWNENLSWSAQLARKGARSGIVSRASAVDPSLSLQLRQKRLLICHAFAVISLLSVAAQKLVAPCTRFIPFANKFGSARTGQHNMKIPFH